MHSDPQISLHAIAVPFNSSRDAKIQRLCRVEVLEGSTVIWSPSTRLCTDQFIRASLPDKIFALAALAMMLNREQFSLQMARMVKAIAILFVSGVAMITAGCETNRLGQSLRTSR